MGFYRPEDLEHVSSPGASRGVAYENEVLFLSIDLEPGYKAAPHDHTYPTLYYITGGEGRVLVGDEWREVSAGTLAMTPPQTMHAVEAKTRLTLIEVQSNCPSWFVDQVLSGQLPSRPK